MARGEKADYLSVGQVAKMLQISDERVHSLIAAGELPCVTIPGAGRYGRTKRIHRQDVLNTLQRWMAASVKRRPLAPRTRVVGETVASKYLGECDAKPKA